MPFPQRLIEGHRAFLGAGLRREQDRYRELAQSGQSPEIMVIGCCDSRVAPEVIFDAAPAALFVVRDVVNSLNNLLTFPRLRTLIERGDIATHGAYFGVATGQLSLRDAASGEFHQIDSSPVLGGRTVGAHDRR